MLERLWSKGNPSALLMGLQTGAATMENSMVVLQTIKNRVGGAGESNGGKMGTTVIEQQQQNKGTYFSRLG